MTFVSAFIVVLFGYLLIGYALSILFYVGLSREWSFFVTYDPGEDRLNDADIEEAADQVLWLWPFVMVVFTVIKFKNLRNLIAKKMIGKK